MYIDNSEIVVRSQHMPVDTVLAREDHRADQPSLAESEQWQMENWNATWQDYPTDTCVPQLVALQASTTPEAVALVAGDQVVSYRELNQRANQLAHYLQSLGVQPNVLVGLCIERSVDMVVGLLGILKAGGAYVPMDPTYQPERLTFMVEDAQIPVLITQQHRTALFPVQGMHIVCLDADVAKLEQQSVTDPTPSITASDLAYVIYTSGSTGQPKGALISHDSLLNLVFWHQRAFAVTSLDRATQVASPAFDATGWELWPYLTTGASVYLPAEDIRVAPALLRDWLLAQEITITFLPTALAESMMTLEWPSTTSLRFLLTGADKLQHYPSPTLPFALINNYGVTEATVVNTSGHVLPAEHTGGPPSIGYPIANTQIYILDEHLRQVAIGEPGELYIGGAGLAKGYLNRPELTAEKFIPHPFSAQAGARLYKTGDLARFLPDGQVAFLKRIDHQVKIRGFRIELEEIEAVLHQHPAVQQAVVTAREDVPGDKRLVAYVVTGQPHTSTTGQHLVQSSRHSYAFQLKRSELRNFLQARLPDYMLPATFVLLDALPLSLNGQVDRAALPAPDVARTLQDEVEALPGTPIEARMTGIVAGLLELEQVGIDDNFFMLGGHSLQGTQLIARIADTFGVALSLRSLFNAPTVRQLSAQIEQLIFVRLEAMSDDEAQLLLKQGR